MAERFNILQTLDSKCFSTDNPSVQISAARILEDTQTGQKYLQVKFVNNGEQTITGLDITVKSGDARIAIQHFTDLNLKYGETSGSKTLIALPKNIRYSEIKILVSNAHEKDIPSPESSTSESIPDFSVEDIPTENSTKKLSLKTILLLATAVLLLIGLLVSNLKIFEGITYTRSELLEEDIRSYPLRLIQLTSYLHGSDYTLPVPFYIAIFGYLLSSIAAILLCLWRTKIEKSIPFIRILPFLPTGFFFSLVGMLDSRNFVSLVDSENGYFVLKRVDSGNAVFACLILLLIADLCYLAFLIVSRHQRKKIRQISSVAEKGISSKKHVPFKTILCCLSEILLIAVVTLFGDSVYTAHQDIFFHNQMSVRGLYSGKVDDFISENYGIDNVHLGEQTIFAITQNNLGSGYNVLDRDELYDNNDQLLGYVYFCGTVPDAVKNILTDSYILSISYSLSDSLIPIENSNIESNSSTPNYAGYWTNGDVLDPYYLGIQVDSSGSTSVLEVQVYSDYYHWTATAYQSTGNVFTYENGFQQSHSEDFNLPDLAGTVTFNFDKNTVTWDDNSGESIVFTDSISDDVFNTFVNKTAAAANSYVDNSQSSIDPIDLAGHYWCEQNSGDAYISMYSSPDNNQEVGNIEIYSQLEKANFSGTLYSIGDNQYETIDELGNHWNLAFYGSSDSPAFELHYILPFGNYQSFGEYVLDEHYYS